MLKMINYKSSVRAPNHEKWLATLEFALLGPLALFEQELMFEVINGQKTALWSSMISFVISEGSHFIHEFSPNTLWTLV